MCGCLQEFVCSIARVYRVEGVQLYIQSKSLCGVVSYPWASLCVCIRMVDAAVHLRLGGWADSCCVCRIFPAVCVNV